MSGTSIVMTVFLTSLLRFVIPPLMAPTSLCIRVLSSVAVVTTPWYSIPGYWLMSHPKACLLKLLARSTLSAGISKCTTLLWCIFSSRARAGRKTGLINNRYVFLPKTRASSIFETRGKLRWFVGGLYWFETFVAFVSDQCPCDYSQCSCDGHYYCW